MTHAESPGRIEHTVLREGSRSRQGGTLDLRQGIPELVGRGRELELIAGALADAGAGRARRLLFVGEPGVGKSALLDRVGDAVASFTLVRSVANEAEADLGYATLLALLRPLGARLGALPDGQREAVRAALELGSAPAESRFAVAAGTLGLLAAAAEETPLAIVLDDVQWIDDASLDAIAFACARLGADAVALVAAGRPGSAERLAGARCEVHALEPLPPEDSATLLERITGDLDARVRDQVVVAAHGSPLALIELSSRLTEAQRAGRVPVPDELSAGDALRRAFAGGVDALLDRARIALLVVALGPRDDPAMLAAALSAAGVAADDLDAAHAAGLVEISAGRAELRHPLVGTAVAASAGPAETRRVHAAIAAVLAPGELRARHLAAATQGADEEVAAELERAAAGVAPAAAASLLARAADLTPQPAEADRRRFGAAEAAWLAGLAPLARSLCERVIDGSAGDVLRARALHLRGQIAHQTEPAPRARSLLLEAAALADDLPHGEVVRILSDAVASSMYAGDTAGALGLAERLAAVAATDGGVEEFWSSLQLGTTLYLNGRGAEGEPHVRRAIALVQEADLLREDPRHLGSAAMAPGWVDEFELGRELGDRAISRARELGALNSLPTSLKFRAWADYDLGHWDAALAGASEAVAIAREIGQASQLCANLGIVAAVLAGRGDEPGCVGAVAEATQLAEELELEWHRSSFFGWRGLLELGLGRHEVAVEHLQRAVEILERIGNLNAREEPFSDLIEALIRTGRVDEARGRLAVFEDMATAEALPRPLGTAARLRGLLDPDETFEGELRASLELLAGERPFGAARTHLCFGERLRRAGERRRARSELEAALEILERLGARPWAERCRQELVASGRTLRTIDPVTREELTPQELQVALQVARGLTNREVAQALFLSPKTVEFHLTRIYRKLDLHARAELVERFADQVS